MASVNPYLNFPGTCEAAFNFYKEVFRTDFATVMRVGDMPPSAGAPAPSPEQAKRIIHISLPISDGAVLMGSDVPDHMGGVVVGNNVYLSLTLDTKEEADRLFAALRTDGKVEMELATPFWGAYWGSLTDKHGTRWMFTWNQSK